MNDKPMRRSSTCSHVQPCMATHGSHSDESALDLNVQPHALMQTPKHFSVYFLFNCCPQPLLHFCIQHFTAMPKSHVHMHRWPLTNNTHHQFFCELAVSWQLPHNSQRPTTPSYAIIELHNCESTPSCHCHPTGEFLARIRASIYCTFITLRVIHLFITCFSVIIVDSPNNSVHNRLCPSYQYPILCSILHCITLPFYHFLISFLLTTALTLPTI